MRYNIGYAARRSRPALYMDVEVAKKLVVGGFSPRDWAVMTVNVNRFLLECSISLDLAHLCRSTILKKIQSHTDENSESAYAKIDSLPLPTRMKAFLRFYPEK